MERWGPHVVGSVKVAPLCSKMYIGAPVGGGRAWVRRDDSTASRNCDVYVPSWDVRLISTAAQEYLVSP